MAKHCRMAFDMLCSQAALTVLAKPSEGNTAGASCSRSCGQRHHFPWAISRLPSLRDTHQPCASVAKGPPFTLFLASRAEPCGAHWTSF